MKMRMAFLVLVILNCGCEMTEPNIGDRPQPRPRNEIITKVQLAVMQHVPPKRERMSFGIQVKAPVGAKILVTGEGYLVTDDEIHLGLGSLSKTDLLANNLSVETQSPAYPVMKLKKTTDGFFSWVPVTGEIYYFACRGKVTEQLCGEVLASLQIIKR